MRAAGFYWVSMDTSDSGLRWEPAEWVEEPFYRGDPPGHWLTLGWEGPMFDENFAEIGGLIASPRS